MRRRVGWRLAWLSIVILLVVGTSARAAPLPGTVHFTAAGDFSASANATAVMNTIHATGSDLTLALGDLSYGTTGQEQSWCDFATAAVGPGYPFELVSGNHESSGTNGNINDFAACLPNQLPGVIGTYGRQYYVDVPADQPLVRFILISPALTFPDGTYAYTAGSARYQWTSQAIDGARSASIPWVVIGMHKPCITIGQYGCDIGADLLNLLLAKKVDLVLAGHDHTYQRSKQLTLGTGCPSITPNSFNAACIADADTAFTQGAGSVLAVVGTGGNSPYNINSSDPEAGYIASAAGANQNPTWGVLDVSATADTLRASFARASGGTFTDSFTISRNQAPNTPPQAAFTSACTGLSCTFDASGSTDPDGTIASYAWTFGDTTTGGGATPSHGYAAAGTYQVGLTVTDDRGATDSTTSSVTVTAPTTTTYVDDAFSRTVSNGFGSAPTGGPWSLTGAAGLFAVDGAFGTIRTGAGSGPAANLAAVSAPSSDLRTAFQPDKQPTGSGFYLSAFGRRTASGAYAGKARISNTGAVSLELDRRTSSGAEVVLQSAVPISGLTYAVGDTLNLRVQTVGASPTTIRAKIWKGTAEPSGWQISTTDGTAGLQTAGSVGLSPYLSSSATNAPITLRIDQLTVTAP